MINYNNRFFKKRRKKNKQEQRNHRALNPESTLILSAKKSKTSRHNLALVRELKKFDNLKQLVNNVDEVIAQLNEMRKRIRLLKNLRSEDL